MGQSRKQKERDSVALEKRLKNWEARREQTMVALTEDFLLSILNAIWKGTNRSQERAVIGLFTQAGWLPIAKDKSFAKSSTALRRVQETIEEMGYFLDPEYKRIIRAGTKVSVLSAVVRGLPEHNPDRARRMYYELRRRRKERKPLGVVVSLVVRK